MQEKLESLAAASEKQGFHLVFSKHPNSRLCGKNPFILNISDFSSMELLSVADAVITDYSSFIFEAIVAKKPVYFYTFDIEEYDVDRGFYIDFRNDIPGKLHTDPNSLIKDISAGACSIDDQQVFLEKYVGLPQSASEDAARLIISNL